ncbi:unnamed protein product [Protopolystoma xenopodis]|uniref:Uncharacterized protein n=1 Tax=Protopolystoma xenopodis TaxID=117903 RepID=A0A3S4ZW96_9PLAT|nr:unnamed protein product [Protopolystoma xenopodis]
MLTALSVARDCEMIDELDRVILVSAQPPPLSSPKSEHLRRVCSSHIQLDATATGKLYSNGVGIKANEPGSIQNITSVNEDNQRSSDAVGSGCDAIRSSSTFAPLDNAGYPGGDTIVPVN